MRGLAGTVIDADADGGRQGVACRHGLQRRMSGVANPASDVIFLGHEPDALGGIIGSRRELLSYLT